MSYGIDNSTSGYSQYYTYFKKIDADQNGKVSKQEFVNGAPNGVEQSAAANLFDLLDTSKSGELSSSDLATAFSRLSTILQSTLIQAQDGCGCGLEDNLPPPPQGNRPDPKDLFAKLDTNGDGSVSEDEFVAGRPDNVTEDQAKKFFEKLTGGSSDALSEEQFVAALETQRPEGHRPPGGGGGGGDPAEVFDALDTNQDGVVSMEEFLAGRPSNVSEDQAKNFFEKLTDGSTDGLTKDQFVSAVESDRPGGRQGADTGSDANGQLLDSLLALLNATGDKDGSAQASGAGTTNSDTLLRAIEAYRNSVQQGALAA